MQRDIILHSIIESLLCTESKAITTHIKTKSANVKQASMKHVTHVKKNMKINKASLKCMVIDIFSLFKPEGSVGYIRTTKFNI
jgi:hypothetical protein